MADTSRGERLARATLVLDSMLRDNGIHHEWKTLEDIAAAVIEAGYPGSTYPDLRAVPHPPATIDKAPNCVHCGDMLWVEADQMFAKVTTVPHYFDALDVWFWLDETGAKWYRRPAEVISVAVSRRQGVEWNVDVNLGAIIPVKALTPGYGEDAA